MKSQKLSQTAVRSQRTGLRNTGLSCVRVCGCVYRLLALHKGVLQWRWLLLLLDAYSMNEHMKLNDGCITKCTLCWEKQVPCRWNLSSLCIRLCLITPGDGSAIVGFFWTEKHISWDLHHPFHFLLLSLSEAYLNAQAVSIIVAVPKLLFCKFNNLLCEWEEEETGSPESHRKQV